MKAAASDTKDCRPGLPFGGWHALPPNGFLQREPQWEGRREEISKFFLCVRVWFAG